MEVTLVNAYWHTNNFLVDVPYVTCMTYMTFSYFGNQHCQRETMK